VLALAWLAFVTLLAGFVLAGRLLGPTRLFLDSYQPPTPYRFVSPPPGFSGPEHTNPSGGDTPIPLSAGRSDPASAFTDDGQVTVSFTPGTFTAPAGQTAVEIRITPVRPQPQPPGGLVADGNAYLVQATLVPVGQPAGPINLPVLLDFRYPNPALKPDSLYRIDGTRWTPIGGTPQELLEVIDARSSQLGTFIAGHHAATVTRPSTPSALLIGAAVALGLVAILLLAGVRIRRPR
jgi:hypothetical protein